MMTYARGVNKSGSKITNSDMATCHYDSKDDVIHNKSNWRIGIFISYLFIRVTVLSRVKIRLLVVLAVMKQSRC